MGSILSTINYGEGEGGRGDERKDFERREKGAEIEDISKSQEIRPPKKTPLTQKGTILCPWKKRTGGTG